MVLAEHVRLHRAEAAAEVHRLLRRQVLVADADDVVVEEGLLDGGEVGRIDRAGEIDTGDRGAETAVEGRDGHGHSQILLPKIWPPVPTAVNRPFGTCRWKSARSEEH